MLEKYYISKKDYTDLNVYRCGVEECNPGHSWGPGVRDHFIIHIILSGKGNFVVNGKTYTLETGQGFLICPDQIVHYEADIKKPWKYSWVGFHGLKAESVLKSANLDINNPVFEYKDRPAAELLTNTLDSMITHLRNENSSDLMLAGYLYQFLSYLVHNQKGSYTKPYKAANKDRYVTKAIEYIEKNYAGHLSVAELARYIRIDRSYLSNLFNKYLDISPSNFIIKYRMDKACELLSNEQLTIGDVARSVGYEDCFQFSKTFKKTKGMSPSLYRKVNYKVGLKGKVIKQY